jgi:GTP-binding protein
MDSDVELIKRLDERGRPHLLVLTKADKLSGNGRAQTERRMDECLEALSLDRPVVLTSANTNRGIGALRRWIQDQLGK